MSDYDEHIQYRPRAKEALHSTLPVKAKRKQPNQSSRLAPYIWASVRSKNLEVIINRRDFKVRLGGFKSLKSAEQWRDEQLARAPKKIRQGRYPEKQPEPPAKGND